jgi:hypothetical protein
MIEGVEGLKSITARRVQNLQTELLAKHEENQQLKSTLEHSLKMVQIQDKVISDLEQKSIQSSAIALPAQL